MRLATRVYGILYKLKQEAIPMSTQPFQLQKFCGIECRKGKAISHIFNPEGNWKVTVSAGLVIVCMNC